MNIQSVKNTLPNLSQSEFENLKTISQNVLTENSRVAYKNDFQKLIEFTKSKGLELNTINEREFVFFLNELATNGYKYSSIKRIVIGTNKVLTHDYNFNFKNSEPVKNYLKGLAKTDTNNLQGTNKINSSKTKSNAIDTNHIINAISNIDIDTKLSNYAKVRNKALILLGFVGGFRRSELVAVKKEHIRFVKQGIEILLLKSKTNQNINDTSQSKEIKTIPYSKLKKLCPVISIKDLIKLNEDSEQLFYSLKRNSDKSEKQLTAQSVNKIIKNYVGNEFTAHSLRAGFVTSAYQAGANIKDVMERTGHKDLQTAMSYVRTIDKWNSTVDLGL